MKKIACLIVIVCFAIFLSSYVDDLSERGLGAVTESTSDSETSLSETYPPATVPVITKETNTWEITEEYEDPFQNFLKLAGRDLFIEKRTLRVSEVRALPFVFFEVIDIEDDYQGYYSVYHVRIVKMYGVSDYDTSKIYRMAWMGRGDAHIYGRPPLEIGKVYGRFLSTTENHLETVSLWQAGLIYDVQVENGKCYVYGYGIDLSKMPCIVEITDPEENSVYKTGKHDKAIAMLEKLGVELPTFDYKCDLIALLKLFGTVR